MRSPATNAELALLLEVAGTPKPGNVDRHREYPDLRFEHFLAGAVGAGEGFRAAAEGTPLGEAFERAIAGMSEQRGGNTQFGAVLLLVPLVRAAAEDDLSPAGARAVVRGTTVEDAVDFYRAFEYVDVTVGDRPDGIEAPDVRRGGDAAPTLEERGLTLADVMDRSASVDGVAREWTSGFPRTFGAAEWLLEGDDTDPVPDRAAEAFLRLLADRPDTFVATQHDEATAREVTERARAARKGDGGETPDALAEEFVRRGINPGTTADITAGGLFVALERGLDV